MIRVIALVLLTVMLLPLSSFLTVEPVEAYAYSDDEKVKEYNKRIEELQQKMKEAKAALAATGANINSQEEIIEELEELQVIISEQITIYEVLLTEWDAEILRLEETIAQQEAAIEESFAHFCDRVSASYEQGSATYLELLLGAENLAEFISKWDYVSALLEYDRKVMEGYREAKTELEMQKLDLEAAREEKAGVLVLLEEQKAELAASEEDAILYLNTLRQQYADQEDTFQQYDEEADEINKELEEYLEELAKKNETQYSGEGMIWPLPGFPRISSHFGPRTYMYKGKKISDNHRGIDIAGAGCHGANIVAVASGTVVTSTHHSSYGNYVIIDHGGGIFTLYAHASKLLVSKGDVVKQGDVVALVGSTGQSTASHLHFEVRVDGKAVDPIENGYVIQPKY